MRQAGRIVHEVLTAMEQAIEPGITTRQLEKLADDIIDAHDSEALFRGVPNPLAGYPFPSCICASANEQVVHGIPGEKPLEAGDIISIDCGVKKQGFCGDAARTYAVGEISPSARKLMDVTKEVLDLAIREIEPGKRWSQIAAPMQKVAEDAGFSVVKDFVGHGIGSSMHEDPKIPNFVSADLKRTDFTLKPGMVLAVEPMVNAGGSAVKYATDKWTVLTRDGSLSAHFEHTIAVTDNGSDVLTDGH